MAGTRKIATIVVADVVGYSRLAGAGFVRVTASRLLSAQHAQAPAALIGETRSEIMQTDLESGFIGVTHLAEKLALSTRTIWRTIERGELRVMRIGRRTLIPLAEVRRWLAGQETPTTGANVTNLSRQFIGR